MRWLTGTGEESVDDTLLTRRRTMEKSALLSRGLGMIATMLFVFGVGGTAFESASPAQRAIGYAGVAAMAVANALALAGLLRPASPRYALFSAMQVALDILVIAGLVAYSERYSGDVSWPILAVPVVVAAVRHQLAGALLAWAITTAAFAAAISGANGASGVRDLFFAGLINLLIALVTGFQSLAFARQLATLNETRRALQHQATHDPLTGLPNRAQLAGYADRFTGRPLAVLLLDLNGFKQVNDDHGHAAGDRLLHEVGVRLTDTLGSEGLAGRLGGDEFLVLLPEAGTAAVARAVVRIRDAIRKPVDIGDGREVTVGVSAGVAFRPEGGDAGLDALSAEADAAMYRDKRGHPRAA
ncbi:GGDEF domain-containing protein [Actinoplanes aureus]|uniref:GGDEF domain-containing protein n=1 Tax=Actinoplanes aureus TaxID=2792083 RepID=A0A931C610_9ACTN|nr:GGDEF domain-containing protein [Actinoplanes aureus]MBG0561098.1 GGDEF domain-containing protein [Actinoplanes aureus]